MRCLFPIAVLLLLSLGCETPATPQPGVQIGSEGLIGTCGSETSGGSETVAGFSRTNDEIAADLLGSWQVSLAGAGVEGTLFLDRASYSAVTEEGDCRAGLLIGLSGDFDAAPLVAGSMVGNALVAPDESARLLLNTPTFEGDLRPGAAVQERERVDLVIDADHDAGEITGSLFLLGCNNTDCIDEPVSGISAVR